MHRSATVAVGLLAIAGLCGMSRAADWPAYRADAARSGVSAESLAFPLSRVWVYHPAQAPQPAWPEPGKELHRMDFDYALQPVAASGLVFFASSADDTVRALAADTGVLKWRFTAGGPIRFAPALANGKAYVASDDGVLYCLDASSGAERWRFRAAPRDDQLLGNSRMISRWPLRSGVLVADGTVYVSAGMWPAEGVCVYAVAADTGKPLWCNREAGSLYMDLPHPTSSAFSGICPQGYLACSGSTLLVPTGRSVPAALDRYSGRLLYYLPSKTQMNGGAWVMTLGGLFLNPQHPHQSDDEAASGEKAPRTGDGMAAYALRDGVQEKGLPLPGILQAAGTEDTLYAAGDGCVEAIDLNAWRKGRPFTDCVLWKKDSARPYSLIVAGKALLIGSADAITALDATSGAPVWREAVGEPVRGLAVSDGRLFAVGRSGALLAFERRAPAPRPTEVREQPVWEVPWTGWYVREAAAIARVAGATQGYALMFGEPDGRLAVALAMRTDLRVIGVVKDAAAAAIERRRLVDTGVYGSRVSIQTVDDLQHLPYASYFADLIVVSGNADGLSGAELHRLLHPGGGMLCLAGNARTAADRLAQEASIATGDVRRLPEFTLLTRGPLAGAGEWRWQMADAGRTGVNAERLARLPAELLWFGGPGPDRMMDRHWRTATPLCVGGRIFVKGQHHILACDAYNGRELWSVEARGAGRQNAWWGAGSFTADDESLYAAVGDSCMRLEQATGWTMATYRLPPETQDAPAPAPAAPPPIADTEWPALWQVIGPLPKGTPLLTNTVLRSMPAEVTVAGRTYQPQPLAAQAGRLDFTCLYGGYGFQPLQPGEKLTVARGEGTKDLASEECLAYAFATIHCPQAGRLTIGAGADWWMQWFVDGKPVFDTLEDGNAVGPYSASNHVFTADVETGDHVLCAMVKAGSMSWCLVSDGGVNFANRIPPTPEERQPPPWGWVGVADDLLLGIRFAPNGTGKDLFALGKDDGRLRWVYKARYGLDGESVALGDGRVYLSDEVSGMDLYAAKARGERLDPARALLALDLKTGATVWRHDDKARRLFQSGVRAVQYARGVVVVDGTAAFDAAQGSNLWRVAVQTGKAPIIHGDWVIDWPLAFDLRTGQACEADDALGRGKRPLRFPRAYGCGDVAGCENLLLFRSGMTGIYDFQAAGTTTFGGVRPNCSISVIPAAGLLLCPEGSSGCSCSYNFQTSLALAPTPRPRDVWYALSGEDSSTPLARLCLNFGAPGDRRDEAGQAWLGWPRPGMPGACAVPAGILAGHPAPWYRPGGSEQVKGTDRPWIYSSGLLGAGQFAAWLRPAESAFAPACEHSPIVNGVLDDACWQAAKPVPFANLAHLQAPQMDLRLCRDATNLYVAFRGAAAMRDGRPLPFVATQTATNAACWRDDECEIFLTDAAQKTGIVLAVTCGGASSQVLRSLAAEHPTADRKWGGRWVCAAARHETEWTAEIAVPLQTLAVAQIDPATLRFNFMAQNQASPGRSRVYVIDPGLEGFDSSRVFRPVVYEPSREPPRRFTVRLHFAEPDDLKPGERVFSVDLQGRRVLKDLDVVKEAGAPRTALVKEFKGIEIADELTLTLTPSGAASPLEPMICGLEAILE